MLHKNVRKLRKFVRRLASLGKRDSFDPAWMRGYQQLLLYGCGAALGIFMMVCAGTAILIEISDYHAKFRAQFLTKRAQLRERMSENRAVLRRLALSAEAAMETRTRPTASVTAQFVARRGNVLLDDGAARRRFVASAVVDADHSAGEYLDLLATSEWMFRRRVPQRYLVPESRRVYLIGNQGRFAAMLARDAPTERRPESQYEHLAPSLQRQWPDVDALVREVAAHPDRASKDVIWLPTRLDPVSSERVVGAALWAFDDQERPVLLIVETMKPVVFQPVADDGDSGAYTIVDRVQPRIVTTSAVNVNDAMVALRATTTDSTPNIEPRFVSGRFVVQQAIPGSDWQLVYVYSMRAIVRGLAPRLLAIFLATLLGLTLLGVVIGVIDRRILGPAFRGATRLQEGERLNRTLIRTAPVGLALISESDGSIQLRNDVMAEYEKPIYGEPLSGRIWRMFMQPVDGRPSGGPRRRMIDQDVTLARVDDEESQWHLLVNIVRVRYRGMDALLCTVVDITARKQTEYSLVEARRAADQANKSKSMFLAAMSHEIRTPLNAVLGNLELMKRAPLPDLQRRRLEVVDSSSATLLRILDDVLDLSRVEAGEMSIDSVPFNLVALLRDVMASFHPLASEKNLCLTADVASDLTPYRIGDPVRLRQILSNLIGNAIKFTDAGTVCVSACERRGNEYDMVEVSVSDTGIGIAELAISTIFEPYRQADESIHRQYGGTGLGLALCKRLIEAMHGGISVRSNPGQGSEFVIQVPLAVAEEPAIDSADAIPARPLDAPNAAPEGRPMPRALAIEDHPASRMLLADQFRELGIDATIVESGAAALDMLASQNFTIVLTDLGLPDTDGWTLAQAIRARDGTLPVVGMTARIGEGDAQRCAAAGIRMLLRKPITLGALQTALHEHARGEVAAADTAPLPLTQLLVDTMREVSLASCASIDRALVSGDAQSIMRELHSLSGGFVSVGQRVLAELCGGLQQVVRDEGVGVFAQLWPALRAELESALDALRVSTHTSMR
ncbi:response regulator [Burkholderia cepacia]|uniref:hybrid sensor histidine kinase/response regulator n=1 Tax=Burkholderia cenocepacia TaxID=95486 RepID=UPI0004F88E41|nr:hybrid sensor histidine kinase/response regulator [Burkholderia cenocepacia]AIO45168.1 response regulator [Burkholderia cepacia]KGC00017.1 response regulator [Burkholderia cepacia]MCG0581880.1 ATP-binding protein [Burkholderia cenocepacia]MCW5124912.1 response regulator [Burkholderia cenocepacia]MDN7657929.1 ATP-binding protein [Burkholderia cenocepacia]